MATIRDVARVAGVSIATVSRVFNDNSLVNEETATRVMAAATSVDYWPNGAAKSLTTRRTNTIGVLLPDLFGEFYSEVIRGIDQLSRRHEYQILLSSSHSSSEAVLAACRAMLGRVDGLIVMAQVEALVDTVERISRRIPVVLLNPRDEMGQHGRWPSTTSAGATAAVEHLLGLGHREIAMVAGPEGNVDAEDRLRDFVAPWPRRVSMRTGPWSSPGTSASPAASPPVRPSWRGSRGPRPCSPPTTAWPSACWPPCAGPAARCPATWRSWASTTSPSPPT